MRILCIDTSTWVLSVAVLDETYLLGEITTNGRKNHSVRLMPAIEQLFQELQIGIEDIDAIAVTSGPGSYTGVRIGITTAKALAWTADLPLYSQSSLATLARNGFYWPNLIVPLFDARRERAYVGVYRRTGLGLDQVMADQVLPIDSLLDQIEKIGEPVLFLGDAVSTFSESITGRLSVPHQWGYGADNAPRASQLGWLITQRARQGELVAEKPDFTPDYLQLSQAESNWLRRSGRGDSRDS